MPIEQKTCFILMFCQINNIYTRVCSKEAGKLLISIIAAVAEMERENIRVQTMAGREQKAREGKWNGGFAPYGYKLENGELVIAKMKLKLSTFETVCLLSKIKNG